MFYYSNVYFIYVIIEVKLESICIDYLYFLMYFINLINGLERCWGVLIFLAFCRSCRGVRRWIEVRFFFGNLRRGFVE